MSTKELHNRRKGDQENVFVKAGAWTRSIRFILVIFSLLLATSLLFQFTTTKGDTDRLKRLLEQGIEQREILTTQADIIIDCTSVGGKCFEQTQRQTSETVANLNTVTQYAVICGQRVTGEQAILDCVNKEVKQLLNNK